MTVRYLLFIISSIILFHISSCSSRCEDYCKKLYNEDECYIVVEGYSEEKCVYDCEKVFEEWSEEARDAFEENMECVESLSCEEIKAGACS